MEHKALALENAQFKLESDGAVFVGYASTFGNVDSYGDTIVKGAYADTLKTHGLPKMFFNHDSGAVPIGKWIEAKEDDYGLLLKGEFTPGNVLAQEVKAALKHGTLDSMSIGYALKKGDYENTEAGRLIKRVARLAETSIVTFPADSYAKVDVTTVKSEELSRRIAELESPRDFENFLRDAGGYSKGAALEFVARFVDVVRLRDAERAVDQMKKSAEEVVVSRLLKLAK